MSPRLGREDAARSSARPEASTRVEALEEETPAFFFRARLSPARAPRSALGADAFRRSHCSRSHFSAHSSSAVSASVSSAGSGRSSPPSSASPNAARKDSKNRSVSDVLSSDGGLDASTFLVPSATSSSASYSSSSRVVACASSASGGVPGCSLAISTTSASSAVPSSLVCVSPSARGARDAAAAASRAARASECSAATVFATRAFWASSSPISPRSASRRDAACRAASSTACAARAAAATDDARRSHATRAASAASPGGTRVADWEDAAALVGIGTDGVTVDSGFERVVSLEVRLDVRLDDRTRSGGLACVRFGRLVADSSSSRFVRSAREALAAASEAAARYAGSSFAATAYARAASSCLPSAVSASPTRTLALAHSGSMRAARRASSSAPPGFSPSARMAAARLEYALASPGAATSAWLYAAIAARSSPVANASFPRARASSACAISWSMDEHPHREHRVSVSSLSGCTLCSVGARSAASGRFASSRACFHASSANARGSRGGGLA